MTIIVVTWGDTEYGGDSSKVAKSLDGTTDVTTIYATSNAFAALRVDGSIITWGVANKGGDSSKVASQIDGTIDVTQIYSTDLAFAALRVDGSVVTWGSSDYGGDSSSVASQLTDVVSMANPYTNDVYIADKSSLPTTSTGNDSLTATNTTQTFDGLSGVDTLSYTNATKTVTVSLASTKAQNTGFGTHTIKNMENIIGSKYNDKLTGSKGNNMLEGDAGKDKLTGGAGSDTFTYKALTDSQVTASKRDTITDFKSGTDKIDLSALDANTATTTDDAFTALISSTAKFTQAGQLQLKSGVLYGNTDTDATAEFAITLTGVKTLAMTDFIA